MRSRFAILSILLVSILSCGQPAATPRHDFSALSFRPLGPGVDGTRIVIEPSRGVTPLIRLIDRAQKQIFVEAYILTHRRIIRALQRAEAQGVGVYVLLDRQPFGMGPQPQQLASTLSAAGVAVRWASPRFTYSHAKFLVIDDRTAVIATANLSKAAYNSNREFLVIDQSPEDVRALSSLFRQDWDRLTGLNRDPNIVLSPRSSRDILSQLVLSARKSIDVYAEEVADSGMEHTLIQAARSVRVRVLVASTYSSPGIAVLLGRGVAVRHLRFPYVHAKVIVADGKEAFVGSENLSTTSLDQNREVGILLRGRVMSQLVRTFEQDWSNAR